MCRLVGWVSKEPSTLAEVLGEDGLAELTALSHQHCDGWGMAWWEGDELRSTSSHLPAHATPEYAAAVREVRSDAALVHLRWATPGIPVTAANTHPFLVDGYAFGHNGAVRPADGLLDLLTADEVAGLRGDTDSERLLHVLLARVDRYGLDEGLRRTVSDVCRDLTPSSLNALLLGRDELTALCAHGAPSQPRDEGGPPEDQPGYFDLRWQQSPGRVVVASEPLGQRPWDRLGNGTALVMQRGTARARTVPVGAFPPAALERERTRRDSSARRNQGETKGRHAPRMTTAQVRVGCDFSFDVPAPVASVFQVQPQSEPRQRLLSESLTFDPPGTHAAYEDTFGNRCARLLVPQGPFTLRYDAIFEVPRVPDETDPAAPQLPVSELPDDVLLYLMPSRFCLSDVLSDEAWSRFGTLPPDWRRVQAVVDMVHGHLAFGYGTSSPTYTAADAFAAGKGVCRDFAHLAISFCRALNIPSRYVFGYLPDMDVPVDPAPMDFAAWMEVWLGDRWWTFDPRNNQHRAGRVVIGRGRDAVDVAMVTSYGAATLKGMTVVADEVLTDEVLT